MLHPIIDQTWASTYFQVAIVFFIFTLGIPTLIAQISYSNEIRKILIPELWKTPILLFEITFLGFTLVLFICFFHPCSSQTLSNCQELIVSIFMTIILVVSCVTNYLVSKTDEYEFALRILYKRSIRSLKISDYISDDIFKLYRDFGKSCKGGREKALIFENLQMLSNNIIEMISYARDSLKEYTSVFFSILKGETEEQEGNEDNYITAIELLSSILY